MQNAIIQQLLQLNHTFYQTFGKAFAVTRRRVQPGITRLLAKMNPAGSWLDLGCGSGSVAEAWAKSPDRHGCYLGVDFSEVLLEEARQSVAGLISVDTIIDFFAGDFSSMEWWHNLDEQYGEQQKAPRFDVVSAFAVLHHIPCAEVRQQIIKRVSAHLAPDGMFVFSVWQPQNSPRLAARILPWETVNLSADQLDEGDVLLDWRFSLPGQPEQTGLRYVHIFSLSELQLLAGSTGFEILQTFESDGEGNRLGLYQIWKKASPSFISV